MPTLTFTSPQDAVDAVINKKTGYSLWDSQEISIGSDLNIDNWEELEEN
jgi:hypothetical protein